MFIQDPKMTWVDYLHFSYHLQSVKNTKVKFHQPENKQNIQLSESRQEGSKIAQASFLEN